MTMSENLEDSWSPEDSTKPLSILSANERSAVQQGATAYCTFKVASAYEQSSPNTSQLDSKPERRSSTSAESSTGAPAPLSWSEVRLLVCLSASGLLAGSCANIQAPFFTHEAHRRGLSSAASCSVFSCFALAHSLAFPAMGWLAPRLGVTRLYRLGLLLAGGTTVAFGLLAYVRRPVMFLAWSLTVRAAEAVGAAAIKTAANTIIIGQFRRRVNSAISVVEGMYGGGLCLGPALGGAMYSLGGYGAPFYTLGSLLLLTAAASLVLMPTVTDESAGKTENDGEERSYRDMLWMVFSASDSWLLLTTLALYAVNWNAIDFNIEPYAHHTLGLQPAELSLFFLGSFAGYAVSSPLWGRLSDAVDNTFLLVAGCLAPAALGVLLIPPAPLLGLQPSRLLLGLGMTLREVFQLGAYLPLLPLMVRLSVAGGLQRDVRGQALVSAVFGAAYSLGNLIGPVGGGLVTDLWGYPTLATWLGGATALLCLAVAARGVVYSTTRHNSL